MNGTTSGIVPTIDLAANNGYPYMNGGFGNGFFGGDGIWMVTTVGVVMETMV